MATLWMPCSTSSRVYRPRPAFYKDAQWGELADWEVELGPHYMTAERMLGVTLYRDEGPEEQIPSIGCSIKWKE